MLKLCCSGALERTCSVTNCCCDLALVALSKELVLMHGLHECLDGVEKGKPSAIDLHNQGIAIKTPSGSSYSQPCQCNQHHRCANHLKCPNAGDVKHISRRLEYAYHIDGDDQPVEGKDHCRHKPQLAKILVQQEAQTGAAGGASKTSAMTMTNNHPFMQQLVSWCMHVARLWRYSYRPCRGHTQALMTS